MIFDDSDLKIFIWGFGVLGFLSLLAKEVRASGVCLIIVSVCIIGRLYFHIKSKVKVPVPPPALVVCRPLKPSDSLKFYKRRRKK